MALCIRSARRAGLLIRYANMLGIKLMKRLLVIPLIVLLGCTSLTPDRVSVLSQIAGQAAALGASEWLAKHPEHRQAFLDAIAALGAVLKTDRTDSRIEAQSLEDAAVSFLAKLPTGTLRGKDGELYVTGDTNGPASLVVWDPALKKGVEVKGEATRPVVKEIYMGMRRALAPKPPVPGREKGIGRVVPEGGSAPDAELDEQFRALEKAKKAPHEFPFLK